MPDARPPAVPAPAEQLVQRCFRIPRWVMACAREVAAATGQPENAVLRAWLMDAADAYQQTKKQPGE